MGGTRTPFLCWDSCIFIAWFNKETDKPLAQMEQILRGIAGGTINLLVSAISYAEVLDRTGKSSAGTDFRGFAKRPNVLVANVDPRIGILAADIRMHTLAMLAAKQIGVSIGIPDALIAATAAIYHVDELHTFDPVLRSLSGHPIVRGIRIGPPDDVPGLP